MAREFDEETPERGRGQGRQKDLVLGPGQFAYIQDLDKGIVRTHVGPASYPPTAKDLPVMFAEEGSNPFVQVTLAECIQKNAYAPEGSYLSLLNPSTVDREKSPQEGINSKTPELQVGRKINIPGPVAFPLWPGQTVQSIDGHQLRSNQYLLVRIYNDDEALKNWGKAVVKTVVSEDGTQTTETAVSGAAPSNLTVGKQYIIKGTEVSFYIPPTGVSVVEDEETGSFVRNALTLERLEYSILVNEGGDKRYETGPAVVFPEPNEAFIVNPKGDKKFRAIELNEIQGIYVKVIADYEENGTEFTAGQELFIKGDTTPIYFPREEHSLIRYDGKTKHFATAIPKGEGRYVMNRVSGNIRVEEGEAMLLLDPRFEVFVHRVLTDKESNLWYPGNSESLEYNRGIRQLVAGTPTTRSGAISEGELIRSARKRSGGKEREVKTAGLADRTSNWSNDMAMAASSHGSAAQSFVADEFSRGSTYQQPRSIMLNTKYQGCPLVIPHTGFAVLKVGADGNREVITGPARVLMNYDQTLEVLTLSRGKPKTTENPLCTVYLRTKNNKVSDFVTVETRDHVKVGLKLSFLCDFEGTTQEEMGKWFEVENYVKFFTDHVRSLLTAGARKFSIADFYVNTTEFVRDTILGVKDEDGRSGRFFSECNLRIQDVEVLDRAIQDQQIANLIQQEQHTVVTETIQIEREQRKLAFTQQHQDIQRKIGIENFQTAQHNNQLLMQRSVSDLEVILTKISSEIQECDNRAKQFEAQGASDMVAHEAKLARDFKQQSQTLDFRTKDQSLRVETLMAEAKALAVKAEVFGPQFTEALMALSNNQTAVDVSKAASAQMLFGGQNVGDFLTKTFAGTAIEGWMRDRVTDAAKRNGSGKTTTTESRPAAS
jgi:major vault protein